MGVALCVQLEWAWRGVSGIKPEGSGLEPDLGQLKEQMVLWVFSE